MPGVLRAVAAKPEGAAGARAWRRGGRWRVWEPSAASVPAGQYGELITPDLQDAVVVAAIARHDGQRDAGQP
jgi:hypothetical protein